MAGGGMCYCAMWNVGDDGGTHTFNMINIQVWYVKHCQGRWSLSTIDGFQFAIKRVEYGNGKLQLLDSFYCSFLFSNFYSTTKNLNNFTQFLILFQIFPPAQQQCELWMVKSKSKQWREIFLMKLKTRS